MTALLAESDPFVRTGMDWETLTFPGNAKGKLDRRAKLSDALATSGRSLAMHVNAMEAVLTRLQGLRKGGKVKETPAQTSAVDSALSVYGAAKALCDTMNRALWKTCNSDMASSKDAAVFAQRLSEWSTWARVRRPDLDGVIMAADDAEPPKQDKAAKKMGAEVLKAFEAWAGAIPLVKAPATPAEAKTALEAAAKAAAAAVMPK